MNLLLVAAKSKISVEAQRKLIEPKRVILLLRISTFLAPARPLAYQVCETDEPEEADLKPRYSATESADSVPAGRRRSPLRRSEEAESE
jgi:hypothetical protein